MSKSLPQPEVSGAAGGGVCDFPVPHLPWETGQRRAVFPDS